MTDDLDRLLAAWAHDSALTGPEIDAMRRAVVREPVVRQPVAVPGARWWKDFTAQMSTVMVSANQAAYGALKS